MHLAVDLKGHALTIKHMHAGIRCQNPRPTPSNLCFWLVVSFQSEPHIMEQDSCQAKTHYEWMKCWASTTISCRMASIGWRDVSFESEGHSGRPRAREPWTNNQPTTLKGHLQLLGRDKMALINSVLVVIDLA